MSTHRDAQSVPDQSCPDRIESALVTQSQNIGIGRRVVFLSAALSSLREAFAAGKSAGRSAERARLAAIAPDDKCGCCGGSESCELPERLAAERARLAEAVTRAHEQQTASLREQESGTRAVRLGAALIALDLLRDAVLSRENNA